LADAVAPPSPPVRADAPPRPASDQPVRESSASVATEARTFAAPSFGGLATAAPAFQPVAVAPPQARPAPSATLPLLDINALAGRWDELVDLLKSQGKPLILAAALQHAHPASVTARGDVMIELDEPNDIYDRAVTDGRADVLTILR